MGKYSRDSKPNIFVRILSAFLILLIAAVAAVTIFIWNKLNLISFDDGSQNTIVSEDELPEPLEDYEINVEGIEISQTVPTVPDVEMNSDSNVINFLLIGVDQKYGSSKYGSRSDCMIIVSFNSPNKTVRLVSLERGIGVPILAGEHEGEYDLLTHIYVWGGPDLLQKTVEHCFKVDIDHYVQLDFKAVTGIVDLIGGIDVEMTGTEAWYLGNHIPLFTSTGNQKPLKKGLNHLDGGTALAYARLREIDSDWQRVERQRKVILAVVDAVKHSSLTELNDLVNGVLPMIQTNMTKLDIAEMMLYIPDFLTSQFDQMTIPKQGTFGGIPIRNNSYGFGIDYEINNDILYRFLYEGVSSEELLAE